MGCSSCGNGSPSGCGNNGHCSTGGCNKSNTYDWISVMDIYDPMGFDLVEVSFKNGSRKEFFINNPWTNAVTGDTVVVETDSGLDTGRLSLSGELVRAQMKKKNVNENRVTHKVMRIAHQRDLEKLGEARSIEKRTLVRARVIARNLGLDMKIGDIEYQGDKRKATFYYTAEGRVDFRELVRSYAQEFKVKVEMRQIGARQESARIGGIGSCGRELCCSTWLSDFKSVSTSAARYQNIAINQTKLSGQCGRLKCCLNYELDTYMDALKHFPKNVDYLKTKRGKVALIKTDIFKGMMFYSYIEEKFRGPLVPLHYDRVKEIKEMNKKGEIPDELQDRIALQKIEDAKEKEIEYADVTGHIELPSVKKSNNRKSNKNKKRNNNKQGNQKRAPKGEQKSDNKKTGPSNQRPNQKQSSSSAGKNQNKKIKPNPKAGKNTNKQNNKTKKD
ncbi:MAG: regulatory iron-sulfur-containing complex subunit RicT [Saprospiraceae bacterium]